MRTVSSDVRTCRQTMATMATMAVAVALSTVVPTPRPVAGAASKTTGGPSAGAWSRPEPDPPRRKDMKAEKLDRLIGADYNEMWMSKTTRITANGNNATGAYSSGRPRTAGPPDRLELPEQLPAQYQQMMRAWLVHRSSCPVEYAWTDLGKSFWPRWIRTGRCGRSEIMSCSWPPGMACIPSSVKVLNLLRWHCWLKNRKHKRKNRDGRPTGPTAANKTAAGRAGRRKKNKKKDDRFRCLWIKVPYPVTEDCTCSCRKPNV